MSQTVQNPPRVASRAQTVKTKRIIGIVAAIVVIGFLVLGTKVVSNDDPLAQSTVEFDSAIFGADNFGEIQAGVEERAVDAVELADALVADPEQAKADYAVESSGGAVYSTTFTGVVGEGASGIHTIAVEGMPADVQIRVQFGPAINGTELRDATGDIQFGQFKNQIDFQDAAAALNDEVKTQVLGDIDTAALEGQTVEITGAFTLLNPKSWLITPVAVDVQ